MPLFGSHTPESLLGRNDSKNPATTCKGITSNGRPCRRSISATGGSQNGVLAVSTIEDGSSAAAAYYCWQHKDQAEDLVDEDATPSKKTRLVTLQERTSLDTLVERLGVLELDPTPGSSDIPNPTGRRFSKNKRPIHHVPRPPTWDSVQNPVIEVPVDLLQQDSPSTQNQHQDYERRTSRRSRPRKEPSFWAMMCCGSADDDYVEVVRHKTRNRPVQRPEMEQSQSRHKHRGGERVSRSETHNPERQSIQQAEGRPQTELAPIARRAKVAVYQDNNSEPVPPARNLATAQARSRSSSAQSTTRPAMTDKPARPLNARASTSETTRLLSLIPSFLSPQITSSLLAELSKPISTTDEPGYIYIFWLTPESQSSPPVDIAKAFMSTDFPGSRTPNRRTGDLLSSQPGVREVNGKRTILLKIGRARNVHRRMTQWENQCGYTPSLLRFYPYVSSTNPSPASTPDVTPKRPVLNPEASEYLRRMSETHARASQGTLSPQASGPRDRRPSLSPENSSSVRQVPNVKRVERLIHVELTDKRLKKECDACGRVHMEWFEVEATREGVKYVDEAVRRWVEWSETNMMRT